MKTYRILVVLSLVALTSMVLPLEASLPSSSVQVELEGPGDKEKKSDEKEEKTKIKKRKFKPARSARRSAKNAKRMNRLKTNELAERARVRNFFHKTFNTKPGKPVNFRRRRQRNRWKRGH